MDHAPRTPRAETLAPMKGPQRPASTAATSWSGSTSMPSGATSLKCGVQTRWPTRSRNGCRRSSTACTPRWAGPRYCRAVVESLSADRPVIGTRRRAFCKGLEYNLLYRWFPGPDLTERGFDATVFTKDRQQLLVHGAGWGPVRRGRVVSRPREAAVGRAPGVDGTLIGAAAFRVSQDWLASSTWPVREPTYAPLLTAKAPFTNTWETPVANWCGSSKVARSATVSGSKTAMSALYPG